MTELEADARAWLAREGDIVGESDIVVSFNLRYAAQAYEIEVIVPAAERLSLDGARLAAMFHAEHQRLYGFCEPDTPIETATVRLGVIGRVPPVPLPEAGQDVPRPRGQRPVWHDGQQVEAQVYARADIGQGARIAGPAVVEQLDTTTFILPGWVAAADRLGTLHLTRERAR